MMINDDGLVQFTITEEDKTQTVSITHDPATGKLDVVYSQLNALQAIQVLADALYIIWKDGVQSKDRPEFPDVESKVCLQLADNKLSMSFGTQAPGGVSVADPILAKAILLSGLFGLCEKTNSGEFNPADAFSGRLTV